MRVLVALANGEDNAHSTIPYGDESDDTREDYYNMAMQSISFEELDQDVLQFLRQYGIYN
jgi:hypothetical protein